VLVTEGYWLERKDRFACFVHWLDRILETLRGNDCAELTVGPNDYSYASGHSHPRYAGDKCSCLCSCRADADGFGFTRNTSVTDIDIVTARCQIFAGIKAECDVVVASCVEEERLNTVGRVAGAVRIVIKRARAAGRVASADVAVERAKTVGCVVAASCIAKERLKTRGGVFDAVRIVIKRTSAVGRVASAADVAIERAKAVGCVVVARYIAKERLKTGGSVFDTGGEAKERIIT
jgi:hypothetical protein